MAIRKKAQSGTSVKRYGGLRQAVADSAVAAKRRTQSPRMRRMSHSGGMETQFLDMKMRAPGRIRTSKPEESYPPPAPHGIGKSEGTIRRKPISKIPIKKSGGKVKKS